MKREDHVNCCADFPRDPATGPGRQADLSDVLRENIELLLPGILLSAEPPLGHKLEDLGATVDGRIEGLRGSPEKWIERRHRNIPIRHLDITCKPLTIAPGQKPVVAYQIMKIIPHQLARSTPVRIHVIVAIESNEIGVGRPRQILGDRMAGGNRPTAQRAKGVMQFRDRGRMISRSRAPSGTPGGATTTHSK